MKAVLIWFLLLYVGVNEASPLLHFSASPPDEAPQVFNLPVPQGFASTERLAFNTDYTEIYYSLVNGYEPDSESSVQYLLFKDGGWQPPVTLVTEFNSPALSVNGKRLFLEGKNHKDVWFMTKKTAGWSSPQKLFASKSERHYFAETDSGNYYYGSLVEGSNNVRDFWQIVNSNIEGPHKPLNMALTSDFPRDFYIAKDESFLITLIPRVNASDIVVYFRQANGKWHEPVSLGKQINGIPGVWKWGFYVTDDHKYLFLTSGNDLRDTRIYWSRFDSLLANLKVQ